MTATDSRRARYANIVHGFSIPPSSLRDADGPQTLTMVEAEIRADRARARFEKAANASRDYREAQIASTLALRRSLAPKFGR